MLRVFVLGAVFSGWKLKAFENKITCMQTPYIKGGNISDNIRLLGAVRTIKPVIVAAIVTSNKVYKVLPLPDAPTPKCYQTDRQISGLQLKSKRI